MSVRYHISSNGEPNVCKAQFKECPLGSDTPHFSNRIDARIHYEKSQPSAFSTPLIKKKSNTPINSNDHILKLLGKTPAEAKKAQERIDNLMNKGKNDLEELKKQAAIFGVEVPINIDEMGSSEREICMERIQKNINREKNKHN